MALHPHVQSFYTEWLNKADSYNNGSLSDYFNKAFSLFTLYNKLYAEASFELARRGTITFDPKRGFPDKKGATEFSPKFVGFDRLYHLFTKNESCRNAISNLIQCLEDERFYIKLSMIYGERQRDKDEVLLRGLKSNGRKKKVRSVLDLIYSVRCNMFHGNKRFDQVQVDLLEPVTVILRAVVIELYDSLQSRM
ncbi:TPA: hypothetical protein ACX6Q3_003315 [Photobacterium damselae]